jgi:hypothetical protein
MIHRDPPGFPRDREPTLYGFFYLNKNIGVQAVFRMVSVWLVFITNTLILLKNLSLQENTKVFSFREKFFRKDAQKQRVFPSLSSLNRVGQSLAIERF